MNIIFVKSYGKRHREFLRMFQIKKPYDANGCSPSNFENVFPSTPGEK